MYCGAFTRVRIAILRRFLGEAATHLATAANVADVASARPALADSAVLPFRPQAFHNRLQNFPFRRLRQDRIKPRRLALRAVQFIGITRHGDQNTILELWVFTD